MKGYYECETCGVVTSDWHFIAGLYWCDEHAENGRKIRAGLAKIDSWRAMMNNMAKRSGNPAVRNTPGGKTP